MNMRMFLPGVAARCQIPNIKKFGVGDQFGTRIPRQSCSRASARMMHGFLYFLHQASWERHLGIGILTKEGEGGGKQKCWEKLSVVDTLVVRILAGQVPVEQFSEQAAN